LFSQGFKEKLRRMLDNVIGRPYKIEERVPGGFLYLPEGLKEGDPDVVLNPNGMLEVKSYSLAGSMSKTAEVYYQIRMYPEDCNLVMRKDNLKGRQMLRKLAPGVVRDFEMGEKFARESSLKHSNDPNLVEVDYSWMRFISRFSSAEMNEEETINELEKRTRAISEAITRFLEWRDSDERKKLNESTSLKRELKSRTFLPYWPPNYGDQKRNEEEIKEVIEFIQKYNAEFYTPHGKLEIQNGKPVIKEEEDPRGK